MKHITKSDYINSLKKRHAFRIRAVLGTIIIGIICFIGIESLYVLVNENSILAIPESARNYLLHTIFLYFSAPELRIILISATGNSTLLPLLLAIYWGYYFLGVLGSLALLFVSFFIPFRMTFNTLRRKPRSEIMFNLHWLLENARDYVKYPTILMRFRLQQVLSNTDLYSYISPIEKEWYDLRKYQWFSSSAISTEARSILFTLTKFNKALNVDLKNAIDISPYLPLLEYLEAYLFSLVNRSNKSKLKIIDLDNNKKEYDILLSFSRSARPIIIRSLCSKRIRKKEREFSLTLKRILQSTVVKFALSISGIAAVVMLIGVLLFRLEAAQAFLTWFTVTFGSLTISVGTESFRQIGKNKKKQQTEDV
jgi:hypothetical protein